MLGRNDGWVFMKKRWEDDVIFISPFIPSNIHSRFTWVDIEILSHNH